MSYYFSRTYKQKYLEKYFNESRTVPGVLITALIWINLIDLKRRTKTLRGFVCNIVRGDTYAG